MAIAAILIAGLTGCSKSTGITRVTDTSTHGAPARPTNTVAPSKPQPGRPNTATISVDGHSVVAGATIRCEAGAAHGMLINLVKDPDDRGVVLAGEPPTVVAANLGDVNGTKFIYIEKLKKAGEGATVTTDGKHYTVTGTVWGNDRKGSGGVIKPFVIDAMCS